MFKNQTVSWLEVKRKKQRYSLGIVHLRGSRIGECQGARSLGLLEEQTEGMGLLMMALLFPLVGCSEDR